MPKWYFVFFYTRQRINNTHTEQFKKSGDKWLVDEWVDVEDWARGYPQEMQDFMEAIAFDRDPISDGQLGLEVVAVTYAAYLSAENRNMSSH